MELEQFWPWEEVWRQKHLRQESCFNQESLLLAHTAVNQDPVNAMKNQKAHKAANKNKQTHNQKQNKKTQPKFIAKDYENGIISKRWKVYLHSNLQFLKSCLFSPCYLVFELLFFPSLLKSYISGPTCSQAKSIWVEKTADCFSIWKTQVKTSLQEGCRHFCTSHPSSAYTPWCQPQVAFQTFICHSMYKTLIKSQL